jgi:hypothetical protein
MMFRRLQPPKRAGWILGGGAAAAALLALGYIATTWYRYGRVADTERRDPLLGRFIPTYEIWERHETRVAAPAATIYRAACEMDLQRCRLVRAIFRGRELLLGSERGREEASRGLLAQALARGWGVLAEEPGREIVLGAVTRP